MLTLRLHRVQVELQSHQQWLKCFLASSLTTSTKYTATYPIARTFVTERSYRKSRQTVRRQLRRALPRSDQQEQERKQKLDSEVLSCREDLLKAIAENDIKTAINLYTALPEKKPLTPSDLHALTQCTHQCLRQENQNTSRMNKDDTDEIVIFASQMVADIEKGRLLFNTSAHVHLLGIFKESGNRDAGVRFWRWLEAQDDEYLSLDVYAVAIELLAKNGSPLEELEELYSNALRRFPGTFSEYHLLPEAILPDREKKINITGLPTNLLQAIALARLLRGDTRKAYLALDTVFRLYPTTVAHRFFTNFKNERPISEVYTLFAMACRAGIQLPRGYFREMVAELRQISDLTSASGHISSLRAMLAAIFLQLRCSGVVASNTLGELVIATTHIFRLPGVSTFDSGERKQLVNAVLNSIRKIMELSAHLGALPPAAVFHSIITNVAGYGGAKNVIGVALADMKALNKQQDEVTHRAILTAAGLLADEAKVRETWQIIVKAREADGTSPDWLDFTVFIKAARRAEIGDFARKEFEQHKSNGPAKLFDSIEHHFDQDLEDSAAKGGKESVSAHALLEGMQDFDTDLTQVAKSMEDQSTAKDFTAQPLPMTLFTLPKVLRLTEIEMREIYDQLTTEKCTTQTSDEAQQSNVQRSISPSSSITPSTSSNPSLGALRYENWKTINYLLWLAGRHDREHEKELDDSIAAGKKPSRRGRGITREEMEGMRGFGISSTHESARTNTDGIASDRVTVARREILRLRGMLQ